MPYTPKHPVQERRRLAAAASASVRRWRRKVRELCPAAAQVKNRVPTATKKGPGRVALSLVVATRRKPA